MSSDSAQAFGLLDLSNLPDEPKPSKTAGGGKKDKPSREGPSQGATPAQKKRGAQSRAGTRVYDQHQRRTPVKPRSGKQAPVAEEEFSTKWKLNTVEEEAKRKRMEFDGYKAEARIRSTAGNHDKAIEMYTKVSIR